MKTISTDSKNKNITEQLAALQELFRKQLPQKIEALEKPWIFLRDHEITEEGLQEIHRIAHTLAGSGGTFGAGEISQIARRLEIRLKEILQKCSITQDCLTPYNIQEINTCIEDLKSTALTWQPSSIPSIVEEKNKTLLKETMRPYIL